MKTLDKVQFLVLVTEVVCLLVLSVYLLNADPDARYGGSLLAYTMLALASLPLYTMVSQATRIKTQVTVSDLVTITPYILSAPALIIQLAIIWCGKHQTNMEVRLGYSLTRKIFITLFPGPGKLLRPRLELGLVPILHSVPHLHITVPGISELHQ